MRVQTHSDAGSFAQLALPFLLRDEVANNLQLGILDSLQRDPGTGFELLATIHDDVDDVVGVLTLNPGRKLVLSELPNGELDLAAEVVARLRARPPGMLGPTDSIRALALALSRVAAIRTSPVGRRGIFALRHLRAPASAAGRFRTAVAADLPLIVDWTACFHSELPALGPPPSSAVLRSRVDSGIVYLWENEASRPVSTATIARESPHAATISFVYTPPSLRGRSYASNCVAGVCKTIFARGKDSCVLYADLDNSSSTGLYRRLGFEQHSETLEVAFKEATDAG